MTDSKSPPLDAFDLSARSRHESLSDGDRRELAQALASSSTLRIAHRLGGDFDAVLGVRSGDDEAIARAAQRALAVRKPPGRRWRMRATLLLAALTCTAVATATLWRFALQSRGSVPQHPVPSVRAPVTKPAAPVTGPARAAAPASPAVSAMPAIPTAERAAPRSAALHAPASASSEPSIESARGLFSEANAARRNGDLTRARSLYLELEREFPSSEEAHASRISLGKLLLADGNAVEAERQFSQYLQSGGTLAEEALVGRAQSLARLGRSADERAAWQALVDRFPNSIYTERAKDRLARIDGATP